MKLNLRDTVKFGILVGLAAILMDAAIAHGLWWENDPYWTYWITKPFLISTTFIIGTAFLGVGLKPGLIITAIHTFILEAYYQWLAPIGLPQEPWWLETRDLWIPGYFVHFLVILSGYLLSLWIWRRSQSRQLLQPAAGETSIRWVLGATTAVLLVDGIITQGVLLQQFPGWTFLVQHFLIAFVFLAAWATFVGFDTKGNLAAALLLSLIWSTYSMYLGPIGLPTAPPQYLSYNEIWLKSLPGAFLSIFFTLWLLTKTWPVTRRDIAKAMLIFLLGVFLLVPNTTTAADHDLEGERMAATAQTSGKGRAVVGPDPYNLSSTQDMEGSIDIAVADIGNRWSPVQNLDQMQITANFKIGSSTYKVTIDKPMPRHPLGKYATWMGVAFNNSMHGDTGIGTSQIPKVRPEISVWGFAAVEKDGTLIAKMAPAHVMVMTQEPLPGIALEVEPEDKGLIGAPDGYLHVMWPQVDSLTMPTPERESRELIGWLALLLINGILLWLVAKEPPVVVTSQVAE